MNEGWAVMNRTSLRLGDRTPYTLAQLVTDPSQSPCGKAARVPCEHVYCFENARLTVNPQLADRDKPLLL
jgi:hypothetical protein